jgi:hypothetical protein
MNTEEKQQLLEKINSFVQTIRESFPKIKGNKAEVDKFYIELNCKKEYGELIESPICLDALQRIPSQIYSENNEDGIRNPTCKEAYLSMSSLDRELAISLIRLHFWFKMPSCSTSGDLDKCEMILKELDEEVAKWNQA